MAKVKLKDSVVILSYTLLHRRKYEQTLKCERLREKGPNC